MVSTINSSQGAFWGLSSPSRCEQVPSSTPGHESSTSVTSNSKQTTKSLNFQDSYSNQDDILFNTNITNKTREDNNDSNTKGQEQQPNQHYNYLQNAEVIANTARISTKTHTSSTLVSRPTTTTYSAIHQENHNKEHDMINKISTTKMNNKGELVNSSSVPSPTTSSLMTSSQFVDNATTNTAKKLVFAPAPIMSPQLSLRFSSGGHGANHNSRCRSSSSISSSSSRESASTSRNQYHNDWRGQEVEKETNTMLPPSPMLSSFHFSPSTSTQNDTSIKNNATTRNHNTIITNPVVPLLDMSKRNENQQSMMLDDNTNDTDIFKNAVVPPTSSTTTTKKSSTMLPLSLSSKKNHQDTNSSTLNYLISPVNAHQEHSPAPLPTHHDDNINNHTACSFQPHHYHEAQSIATMEEMERRLLLQNYNRQRELLLVQSSNDDQQSSPSTTSPPNTTLNNGNTTNASTSSSHVSSIPLAINCSSPHPSPIYSCNIDKEILESKEYFIPPNLLINSNSNNSRIKHSQSNNDSNAIAPASNHSTVSDNDDYNNTRLSFETYLNRYHTPNIKEQEESVKARRFECFTTRPYMPLSNHEDRRISPFLSFVCSECIEIFKADDIMVKSRACNKVMLHQIGIRCRFCAHYRNPRARSKRSSAFPSSTCRIYQTLNVVINEHLTICPEIPQDMKDKFVKLKASRTSNKSSTSKVFWKTSAESVGMVNTKKGIGMINPLSLIFPSLVSSSASSS